MVESKIGHTSTIEAAINAGEPTILYDAGGRSMAVPPEDAEHWITQGLMRDPYDPDESISELKALGPAIIDAFTDLVATVGEDGVIDTGETAQLATARLAQNRFNTVCSRILRGIESRYPVMATGKTVSMIGVDDNGKEFETEVSAGQKEMYLERGYRMDE